MDDPLNWHDLEILHAVLEQGTFSQAAHVLGFSQPTVSRHIDTLERKLGKELFTRASSGLVPSEVALTLGEHTGQMSDGMFAIQRALDGEEEAPEGIVTLSLPYGFGSIVLAGALDGFHLRYPEISIDLKFGPPQSNLGRREADIDLRWNEPSEPEVIGRPLKSFHMGFYASETYIARHGIPTEPAEMRDHYYPYVDEAIMDLLLESLAGHKIYPRHFPFRCSGNMMLSVSLGTLGITLCMAPISFEAAALQRILPEYHFESPPLWLTMHSALRRNTRIRVVWDWLLEHLPPVMAQTRV